MSLQHLERVEKHIRGLAADGLDWTSFVVAVSDAVRSVVPFSRSCWHSVDPGTVLFTGSITRNLECSGSWLAEHEYVVEDVNKWSFLARSGRRAGATSIATHGHLTRSARNRSHTNLGIGDELRASFVSGGVYWGAAGFLRESEDPWFTEHEVAAVAALTDPIAIGTRRALVSAVVRDTVPVDSGPGVVLFDERGRPESTSPAARRWIAELVEDPAPADAAASKIVQAVAARARSFAGQDPLHLAARSRVRTRSGHWLLLYASALSGGPAGRIAVVIQPASALDVAPLVALAYGLSSRERAITALCVQGLATKQMADELQVSPYTVQDHLKSIFDKTGVRSRGELVGRIFLEHYVPRWAPLTSPPDGWHGYDEPR